MGKKRQKPAGGIVAPPHQTFTTNGEPDPDLSKFRAGLHQMVDTVNSSLPSYVGGPVPPGMRSGQFVDLPVQPPPHPDTLGSVGYTRNANDAIKYLRAVGPSSDPSIRVHAPYASNPRPKK